MSKKYSLPIILIMLLLFPVLLIQAQLKLPATDRDLVIELLSNTSFETDTDTNKIPDGWTGKNTSLVKADRLKCNKDTDGDEIDDVFFAHTGKCAFMFRGNTGGIKSKLVQNVTDFSDLSDGAEVNFSAFIDPRSGIVDSVFAVAKFRLSDNPSIKLKLQIPSTVSRGVEDYVYLVSTTNLDLASSSITKVKVDLRYGGQTGKFLVDDVSLTTVIIEATPTSSASLTMTVTPTETAPLTETPAPSVTFTPTMTLTSTVTPDSTLISAPDGIAFDYFGHSIAMDGNTLTVGGYGFDGGDSFTGAVYVFVFDGMTWLLQQKLTPPGSPAEVQFGYVVALDNDTLLVGANGDSDFTGAAHVYVRSGSVWTWQAKLTAPDGVDGDSAGMSVALDGDTALLGTSAHNDFLGAAYVFTRTGTTWSFQQKLTAPDGVAYDDFARMLVIKGETAAITAAKRTEESLGQGAVYIFTRLGNVWSFQQKLTADDGTNYDNFGQAIALDYITMLIGAEGDNSNRGSAYIFTFNGVWVQQQKLMASDGANNDRFGHAVALLGENLVIGAHIDDSARGAAYVFHFNGTWLEQDKLTAFDGNNTELFGSSVGINVNFAAAGAPYHKIGENTAQGAAYLFELP